MYTRIRAVAETGPSESSSHQPTCTHHAHVRMYVHLNPDRNYRCCVQMTRDVPSSLWAYEHWTKKRRTSVYRNAKIFLRSRTYDLKHAEMAYRVCLMDLVENIWLYVCTIDVLTTRCWIYTRCVFVYTISTKPIYVMRDVGNWNAQVHVPRRRI